MPDFHENLKQLMLINTAGGITSGDEYDLQYLKLIVQTFVFQIKQQKKFIVVLVDPANLEINVNLLNNSNLFWLPKELILFNNCNLKKKN